MAWRTLGILSWLTLAAALAGPAPADEQPDAADPYTLTGPRSFLTGHPARNADGTINVVVEIPSGTTAKWEVDKRDGAMRWEFRDGAPRIVKYLPYPGNYGMVPRTLLPLEAGGDGDPLDVVVLAPSIARGTVVKARVIGVLKLLDGGEQDDKLLAVREGTALGHLRDVSELDAQFPGATTILETWFVHYKGPGETESLGFGSAEVAGEILDTAVAAFEPPAAGAR